MTLSKTRLIAPGVLFHSVAYLHESELGCDDQFTGAPAWASRCAPRGRMKSAADGRRWPRHPAKPDGQTRHRTTRSRRLVSGFWVRGRKAGRLNCAGKSTTRDEGDSTDLDNRKGRCPWIYTSISDTAENLASHDSQVGEQSTLHRSAVSAPCDQGIRAEGDVHLLATNTGNVATWQTTTLIIGARATLAVVHCAKGVCYSGVPSSDTRRQKRRVVPR
jgi:hypothetical protein